MKRVIVSIVSSLAFAAAAHAQNVEFKNPPELGNAHGYSQVVIVNRGRIAFVSGQTGVNAKGEIVGKGDFAAQAKQAFSNLSAALAAAGATPANIVKMNYYVVGLDHAKLLALRDARDSIIDKQHPPASTLAGVQMLFRDDALIEIEAEAVVP